MAARKGRGRITSDGGDADAGGERAVEGAFAEPAREAAQEVLAEELAEQVVGQGHAAGGDDVGEDQLRQPQQAEEAGAAAVEGGERAQQAQVLDRARRSTAMSTIGLSAVTVATRLAERVMRRRASASSGATISRSASASSSPGSCTSRACSRKRRTLQACSGRPA